MRQIARFFPAFMAILAGVIRDRTGALQVAIDTPGRGWVTPIVKVKAESWG